MTDEAPERFMVVTDPGGTTVTAGEMKDKVYAGLTVEEAAARVATYNDGAIELGLSVRAKAIPLEQRAAA